MSPSLRSRVLVGLAPDCVAAIHVRSGWRASPTSSIRRDCTDRASVSWTGALAALDEVLGELPRQAGNASVVISNKLVRFVQVPWTEGIHGTADRHALALTCLGSVYGDDAVGSWRVVVDEAGFGRASLAAAVDDALVEGLRETLARRRLRLASLQPHLAISFRRWRQHLKADDGGFVVVEPGCVTALFRRGTVWSEVTNRLCRADMGSSECTVVQCVDADSLRGGEGGIVLVAPREVAVEGAANARPIRRLAAEASPWPADPWRTLAWNAA